MRISRAALALTLPLLGTAGVAVDHARNAPSPSSPAVHSALTSELEAGSDSVESLSQTALEERLDQLEKELSAGASSFPSSGHTSIGPASAGFGLD